MGASTLPPVSIDYTTRLLVDLLNTPSPTGNTGAAMTLLARYAADLPVALSQTRKGGLLLTWPGADDEPRALTAHVDTLGAMVREIKSSGRLAITQLGGYSWQSIETEGCTVETADGRSYRGTILVTKASVHVHGAETRELERKQENYEVRLDAPTQDADETYDLGVEVGDFVYLDPRVEINQGFVRSRHLDDKAGVACIFGALKALVDAGMAPAQRTTVLISNYEEVGHGASAGIPQDVAELLAVDMAAVGQGQNSDEFSAGICVKDSGGPYHIDMRRKLVRLCQEHGIEYRLDIYPYYGSDGEAAWRAGADLRVGLIGPGVDASHSYERTHQDSLHETTRLIVAYLLS